MKTRSRTPSSAKGRPQKVRELERRLRLLDGQLQVLERERQKLSAVVSHTDAGFLVFDDSLHVTWANNLFAARFCSSENPNSVLGSACHEVLCNRPGPCEECPAARPFRSGIVAHHEMHQETDGQVRYTYATAMPIKSLRGTVDQTIVMLQDVSRLQILRKSQQALSDSEARYRNLFNSITDAVIVADPSRCITDVNPTFRRMFGYTLDEVRGRKTLLLYADQNEFHAFGKALSSLDGRATIIRAMTLRRKSGELFPAEVAAFQLKDSSGSLTGYVGLARDVGELRLLEEQVRQSQKMESIGQLAGGVAHDFNNLLTAILGHSHLALKTTRPDDPLHAHVEEIKSAGERAAALTRQLLAFSRRQLLEPKVIDLNNIVVKMEGMLRRLIGEDIKLKTSMGADLGLVKTDPSQMEQVLMNLAINARDAMSKGGTIIIETANIDLDENYASRHFGARPGSFVMLAVSDTGCGMSPQTQARIFEPFFTTKRSGKGTGLGLSVVYGIVKQSRGNIWVYSERGQGTTFKIYLPRVAATLEAGEVCEPAPLPVRGSETVLLVEDEVAVRSLTRDLLGDQGYRVLEASDPDEALSICEKHSGPIHLILTDVIMPGMNGKELADRVIVSRPDTKVLFMSGYTGEAIAQQGLLDVDVAYVQKPFTLDNLAKKLREVLDSRAPAADR